MNRAEYLWSGEYPNLAIHAPEAVENLHSPSHRFHIISEHLTDLHEGLRYFVRVHRCLMDLSVGQYDPADAESVNDSFEYLTSKTNTLRRWVVNYS